MEPSPTHRPSTTTSTNDESKTTQTTTALHPASASPSPSHTHPTPPPIHYSLTTHHRPSKILLTALLSFIEAGLLPLILFYALRWGTHLSITANLAIITSLIGTFSGYRLAVRTWSLWIAENSRDCRPIGSGRWGFDTFQVLIILALTGFFVPLIIGSSLNPASPPTVALALPIFMLTLSLPLLLTGLLSHRLRLPIRISSLPPNEPLPPLTYTIVEDVLAVDGGGGLELRQRWRERYEASRVMRELLRRLSIFWGASGALVAAALIVVDWTTTQDVGYGVCYGLPWLWALAAAGVTYVWVKKALVRERENWGRGSVHKDVSLHIEGAERQGTPSEMQQV